MTRQVSFVASIFYPGSSRRLEVYEQVLGLTLAGLFGLMIYGGSGQRLSTGATRSRGSSSSHFDDSSGSVQIWRWAAILEGSSGRDGWRCLRMTERLWTLR